jgi:uncharacterized protein YigE (DUF2233 family)
MPVLAWRCFAAALCLGLAPQMANAACRAESFEDSAYSVCSFDLTRTELRLFWKRADGKPYASFSALAKDLEGQGRPLAFAMNAGMYQDDLSPVGLYIEAGKELRKANTTDAPAHLQPVPNFYKKPNGIFYIDGDEAGVMTTEAFLNVRPETEYATQSGPMLLIKGAVHPAFIPGSTDLKPRNGVCTTSPHEVHFAISEGRVNFDGFARFFRDRIGCRDALFLDGGSASGLYAPEIGRNDRPPWEGYGPMVGALARE